MSVDRHGRGAPPDPLCRRPSAEGAATSAAIPGRTPRSACSSASRRRSSARSARTALDGLHIAIQGAGSVASGRCAARRRRRRAAVDRRRRCRARRKALADTVGGNVVDPDEDAVPRSRRASAPTRLARSSTEATIARLNAPIVAGGANNQLATPADGERLHERGILYAPDYVINAGGIINVCTEYLGDGDASLVRERIEGIPQRLEQIWAESARQRPRPGRGRRRDGAAADRTGLTAGRCTRLRIRRGSCASPARRPRWLLWHRPGAGGGAG